MKRTSTLFAIALSSIMLMACAPSDVGTTVGAASGAGIGYAVSNNAAGAAIGAGAGALIGKKIGEDQEDLAAFSEREDEPEISYEALLDDLKKHGKIIRVRNRQHCGTIRKPPCK